jgi:hypothetical protein
MALGPNELANWATHCSKLAAAPSSQYLVNLTRFSTVFSTLAASHPKELLAVLGAASRNTGHLVRREMSRLIRVAPKEAGVYLASLSEVSDLVSQHAMRRCLRLVDDGAKQATTLRPVLRRLVRKSPHSLESFLLAVSSRVEASRPAVAA